MKAKYFYNLFSQETKTGILLGMIFLFFQIFKNWTLKFQKMSLFKGSFLVDKIFFQSYNFEV